MVGQALFAFTVANKEKNREKPGKHTEKRSLLGKIVKNSLQKRVNET